MLYQKILIERQRLENQLRQINQTLSALPDGKLICSRTGSRFKWYVSDGHTQTYLPKHLRTQAEQLAYKKYLSLKADTLSQEITALNFYLKHHPSSPDPADKLLLEHSEYQKLLRSSFQPISQELSDWANAPYINNPYYPEHLIHKTDAGIFVRSKSEAMIVHFLYTNKIPFRYECALTLGSKTIYPDFTIRHAQTGDFYYHEHFGRMDEPSYSQRATSKLELYISNGFIPSIQLITTYETAKHPLTFDQISSAYSELLL